MTGFDALQDLFTAREFAAIGLPSPGAVIVQPPTLLPDGDDAALWAWFNAVPQPGPIYAPSGSDFFTAYSAVIGALIAGSGPLDPIAAAKKRLAKWGSAPPSWSKGSSGMKRLLADAPKLAFSFTAPPSIQPEFWGLIGGAPSPSNPDLSDVFAGGDVKAQVTCAHLLTFAPQPGDWYVSSALSLAYNTPGKAPWDPASPVTWASTFGPNGSLQRMLSALIVVSGLDASADSTAPFDAADQRSVADGVRSRGGWPYYLSSPEGTTNVTFDATGRLSLAMKSHPKAAIALAAIVQTAPNYLGL